MSDYRERFWADRERRHCAIDAWVASRKIASSAMSDDSTGKTQETTIESAARTTIDALIGGRVGRQTREDLGDALKRATRDSGVGNAIIGRRAP